MDKADKELNLNTLIPVFRTLPCLSQSRDLIYKLVSNKACDLWKELKTKDILEILRVLNLMGQYQCHYSQKATLGMISQWSLVNVHNLKEQELLGNLSWNFNYSVIFFFVAKLKTEKSSL